MAPNQPLWLRFLFRVASRRATEAEVGDVAEEYVGGPPQQHLAGAAGGEHHAPATLALDDFRERGRDALERATRSPLRPADAWAKPGIRVCRRRPDCPRYRHQYGRLCHPQQHRLAAAAGHGSRRAREYLSGLPWGPASAGVRRAQLVFDARIPRLSRRRAYVVGPDGVFARMDRDARSRGAPGNRRHPRHLQLLRCARPAAGARHGVHVCQLRQRGCAAGRRPESCTLERSVRRRSEHPRQADYAERTQRDGGGHRPVRVRRSRHAEGRLLCADGDGRRATAGPESTRNRQRELAHVDRASPGRCATRASPGGSRDDRQPHRSAAAGPHDVDDRRACGRPVAPGPTPQRASRGGHRPRRVRARAAHRGGQRRQPRARAGGGSNEGNRDPSLRRRHPRPPHSAVADRKRDHRDRRRRVRRAARVVAVPGAHSLAARVGWRRTDENRRNPRSHGTGVRAWADNDDGAGVWLGPRAAGFTWRCPRRHEAGRPRLQRRTRAGFAER